MSSSLKVLTDTKNNGYELFVKDSSAREVFLSYLQSIYQKNTTDRQNDYFGKNESKKMILTDVLDDYLLPTGGSNIHEITANIDKIRSFLSSNNKISNDSIKNGLILNVTNTNDASDHIEGNIAIAVNENQSDKQKEKQILQLALSSLFPSFVESKEYSAYVETSYEKNNDLYDSKDGTREERLDEIFAYGNSTVSAAIEQATLSIDRLEIDFLLSDSQWLSNTLALVEELPFCVSLATARSNRRGFPLVYVNKAFESSTGYHRNDIVGMNCSFLQSDASEVEQIEKLTKALATAQPVKIAITNKRKNGSNFLNLLAMKPIFDKDGNYAYVIGVQYDLTQPHASLRDIKAVDDLLSILPNIVERYF